MGRGTVGLVWLLMLVGFGAAYGMGEADGRKRAEGLAAARESGYLNRIEQVGRMLIERGMPKEGEGTVGESPPANSAHRESLSRARSTTPSTGGEPSIQSPLVARGP